MVYGSASTMIRKRKVPVVWMPSRKLTLRLPPVAHRAPSAIAPAESVEFIPPPLGWLGAPSSVVGCTVPVHGGDPAPEAVHVPASLMGPTPTSTTPVRARRSATPPPGLGNVDISTMRNRSLVTGAPVELMTRRRTVSVPNVGLFAGSEVKLRVRFGCAEVATVPSRNATPTPEVSRRIGLAMFSGPGAPSRCWMPEMKVPWVSAQRESDEFSFVSFGRPLEACPMLRKKVCSVVEPETAPRLLGSLSRSQTTPVLVPKPTASNRLADAMLMRFEVEKTATLRSLSMSVDIVRLPAAAPVPP